MRSEIVEAASIPRYEHHGLLVEPAKARRLVAVWEGEGWEKVAEHASVTRRGWLYVELRRRVR